MIKKLFKKIMTISLVGILLFSCIGCNEQEETRQIPEVDQGDLTVFYKPTVDYCGDPIPYADEDNLYLYYIHDGRGWNEGYFHPWNMVMTSDLCSYTDKGRVIAGTFNRKNEQDYGIGTGTVLKGQDGKYHAFYTGWNGYAPQVRDPEVEYNEKIQHAVSDDLVTWTKIPEDGFYGGVNDFRDPHVVWVEEKNEYWMIISTWYSSSRYSPVLKKYVSTDLSNWTYSGIYFDQAENNVFMECPTLMKYNGYWYLSYFQKDVDGTNKRVTRYYYKKNIDDEWIKPSENYFDGAGYSAARLIAFKNKLYAVGWVGTKIGDYDPGLYTWAGNLLLYELNQQSDGSLKVGPVTEVIDKLNNKTYYDVFLKTNDVEYSDSEITFNSSTGYNYLLYNEVRENIMRLDFTISNASGKMGLTFARKKDFGYGEVCIQIDAENALFEFYNTKPSLTGSVDECQSFIKVTKANKYECTLICQDECCVLYVNGEKALSNRIYNLTGYCFGFYDDGSGSKISNIQFYE